jgi:glutamate synthase (NADPH/NADH) small chain
VGKITGFMEFQRQEEGYLPPTRLKNYKEFVIPLTTSRPRFRARCMDCGIPFCNNGCPVNNIIPDWNDLVYRGNYREALDTLHSTNNFPSSPAASARRRARRPVRWASTKPVGIKSIEHAIIDKAGNTAGWCRSRQQTGKKVAVVGSGPAGLAAPSSWRAPATT